jgi:flavin-binding protein dodecin
VVARPHPTIAGARNATGSLTLEDNMAIHKVIEVISQSNKSWEDAAQQAVTDAARTVKQIKSIWIRNFEAVVKNGKIAEYRVNANITFEVK